VSWWLFTGDVGN